MAELHFIWWGPYGDKAIERPLEVRKALADQPITFWCKTSELARFRIAVRNKNITVKSCSDVRHIAGGHYRGEDRHLFDRAQDVIRQLDAYRAYAAVKDVLSLAILHAVGGYYLDTTVRFRAGEQGGQKLRQALAVHHSRARVAQNTPSTGRTQPHVVRSLVPERIAMGWQRQAMVPLEHDMKEGESLLEKHPIPPAPFLVHTRSIDVWAMYGPPVPDPILKDALKSYVARATVMGLYWLAPRPAIGREIMERAKGPKEIEKLDPAIQKRETNLLQARNSLIGQLVIQSVLDAFLSSGLPEFGLPFDQTPEKVVKEDGTSSTVFRGHLLDFGMEKVFGGTWRSMVVPAPAPAAQPVAPAGTGA